jgi:NodT family efflux transporter outer membrane factor (OMF) lipoprotein
MPDSSFLTDATRRLPARTGRSASGEFRRVRLLCVAIGVMMLSGCHVLHNWYHNGFKVGPNYGRPAAPVADAWIDAEEARIRAELPNNPLWWESFQDPTLNELIATMYAQNLSLRVAGMRVVEARALRGVAVGGLFPQSQRALGQYSRTQLSVTTAGIGQLIGGPGPFAIDRMQDLWTTGFDAAWELDIWGRFRRSIEAADAELDATIEDYDAVLVALLAETAAAYVEYRTAQQQLAFAEANVKTQQGSLEIATAKFAQGASNELDPQQALANLKNTQQLLPQFTARVRNANLQLCTLLGIPPRDLTGELGDGPIPTAGPDIVVGIPADLVRRRPDVRAAERRVAAQCARIGVAAADLYPHFSIHGALRLDAERFKDLFSQASSFGAIGTGFSWDILNYGRLINAVRVQDARFQQLAYEYQQIVLEANQEVETALNNFLNAQERLRYAEEAVAASQRSVEIVELQYREGVADFNRVFVVQRLLVQDQERLALARGEVAVFLIAAYKAIGGGWEIRAGATNPAAVAAAEGAPSEAVPAPADPAPAPADTLDPASL